MSGPGKQKSTISPAWLTGEGATDGSSNAISNNGNGAHAGASSTGSVKNEITQVKTEATKPKFVPKVPVKKEAIVVPATSSEPSESANKSDSSKNNDKKLKQNGNNKSIRIDKFQPKVKSVGFSDQAHHGSRKWVMPVGATFFTGTNSVGGGSSSTQSGGSALKIGGVPVPLAAGASSVVGPGGVTRIARPNEQITQVPAVKVIKSMSNSSFVSYTSQPESDSDADDPDAPEDPEDVTMMTDEVWPPLDYDPLAPLALPLGPKSLAMRNMLAAEPILADPADEAALEKEQASSLFVMQMPSDLNLEKVAERIDSSNNGDGEVNRTQIGKMQLLRSGKVRLVTTDGKVYEVNSGMASSFVQILTAMEVPADPKADASSSAALSAASASGSAMGGASGGTGGGRAKGAAAVEAPPAPKGVMSLMGSITKKLVITPAHDIGVRRRRGYSSHSAPNHAGVPGESVFAAAAVGMNKQYPEDDEVIMMDS